MINTIRAGLSHRNGIIRKSAAAALRVPRWMSRHLARAEDYRLVPPVLANSFPKSGTHLLFQIVNALPNSRNYGAFLASMTSSFRFRERSVANTLRFIRQIAPGETLRGHLFFHPQYATTLADLNVVHYFIYRDPRDVVVSEAHYLRVMNRWHRLAPYFKAAPNLEDAITLSITGLEPTSAGNQYPNIMERFTRYSDWIKRSDCLAIRFEDLITECRGEVIEKMVAFYTRRRATEIDARATTDLALTSIAPERSHTFRSGKKSGWQTAFNIKHRELFHQMAGDLLIELGYEVDDSWVTTPTGSTAE